ncbi:MAG: hypothetical protein ACO1OO_13070 [Flavisolibacter sp.]
MRKFHLYLFAVLLVFALAAPGCVSTKKVDEFVAMQYNNKIPKIRGKSETINITSPLHTGEKNISSTIRSQKVLPLLVYWKFDYRLTTALNSEIPLAYFTNSVYSHATKALKDKIGDGKLELTVEQVPSSFQLVSISHKVFVLLYVVGWDRNFMANDEKPLVVSYKFTKPGTAEKTGTIIIPNKMSERGQRLFESWKSATSDYIGEFNANMTNMSKALINRLAEEI